jgi:hypothetical protein
MNPTELIPKDAVSVLALGNHGPAAGYLTVIPQKPVTTQA